MTEYNRFEGINFEWNGSCFVPWMSSGLDCLGLANYFRRWGQKDLLPFDRKFANNYSRVTLPKDYIENQFRNSPHAFELMSVNLLNDFDIVIMDSPRGGVMGTYAQGQILMFGADGRSRWVSMTSPLASQILSLWTVAI